MKSLIIKKIDIIISKDWLHFYYMRRNNVNMRKEKAWNFGGILSILGIREISSDSGKN